MMKVLWLSVGFCAVMLLFNCNVGAQENDIAKYKVVQLAWLAGSWTGTEGRTETEEHWIAPKGGMMLAVNRTTNGDKASFEFLRIQQSQDSIIYFASPRGQNPVAFKLIELNNQKVVFENKENDFPQRISYRREGNTLNAAIEGKSDGQIRRVEWQWKLKQ